MFSDKRFHSYNAGVTLMQFNKAIISVAVWHPVKVWCNALTLKVTGCFSGYAYVSGQL